MLQGTLGTLVQVFPPGKTSTKLRPCYLELCLAMSCRPLRAEILELLGLPHPLSKHTHSEHFSVFTLQTSPQFIVTDYFFPATHFTKYLPSQYPSHWCWVAPLRSPEAPLCSRLYKSSSLRLSSQDKCSRLPNILVPSVELQFFSDLLELGVQASSQVWSKWQIKEGQALPQNIGCARADTSQHTAGLHH